MRLFVLYRVCQIILLGLYKAYRHFDWMASLLSDVPTGFKKMELPVVKFDAVRAVGKEGDDESKEDDDDNEFTIHPEGE